MSEDNIQSEKFRPRARLLRILGEELIGDEIVAIMELVKNAYDADAENVLVELNNVKTDDGEIIITDDGCGMAMDIVVNSWMQMGTSFKRKRQFSDTKKRRVLGEKGVGRFAVDKLGQILELHTKTKKSTKVIYASFDWSQYDKELFLDEITHRIEEVGPIRIKKHGTILHIKKLRSKWDEKMVEKLNLSLLKIISPFCPSDDFRIRVISKEFENFQGEISNKLFDKAPYQMTARVKPDKEISIEIKGKDEYEIDIPKENKFVCGPFKIFLRAWDLDADGLKPIGMGVYRARELLKKWSGISIYRDDFRIFPYGEEGEDWLELNRRRIDIPTERFSRNQILGFIEISRDHNPDLRDQTNREGLVRNQAYNDLKTIVLKVILELENHRISIKGRKGERKERFKERLIDRQILENMSEYLRKEKEPNRIYLSSMVKRAIDVSMESEKRILEVIARYRRLAGLGEMAGRVIHEIRQPVGFIRRKCSANIKRLMKNIFRRTKLIEDLDTIDEEANNINQSITKWEPFIRAKREKEVINICDIIERASKYYAGDMKKLKIRLDYPDPKENSFSVKIDPVDGIQIFKNLFDNSIYWLRENKKERRIKVSVFEKKSEMVIRVSDNGQGINVENPEEIFLPGWTRKPKGSGLGLAIAGELLVDNNGKIELVESELEKGATFQIRFTREER